MTLSFASLRKGSSAQATGTAPAANAGLAGAYCVVSAAAQPVSAQFQLVPEMFSAPNVNTYNPSNTNSYWRDVTGFADLASSVDPSSAKGSTGVEIVSALASAANHNLCIHATFDTQK